MNDKRRKIKKTNKIIKNIIAISFLLFVLTHYNLATWQQCLQEQHPQPVFLNGVQGGYYPSIIFDPNSFGEDAGAVIGGGPDTYSVSPYYKMWFSDGTVGGQIGFAYSDDGISLAHLCKLFLYGSHQSPPCGLIIYRHNLYDLVLGHLGAV